MRHPTTRKLVSDHHDFILRFVALAVALNGLLILWSSLVQGIIDRDTVRPANFVIVNIRTIEAITLLYLSQLLAQRKRAAWAVVVPVYAFILGSNLELLVDHHHVPLEFWIRDLLLPLVIIGCLLFYRDRFTVKSDIRNFAFSLRFVFLALVVTFLYGIAGFMLLDKHDFHQEIGFWEAAHRTLDQFNITTTHSLVAYTRRARLFQDSLSTVSAAALAYSIVSFFQPLRARYSGQGANQKQMQQLLETNISNSEDYFKLWPHDKAYVFNGAHSAGVAYRVQQGVALACGAPVGKKSALSSALREFEDLCRTNDWLPALVHVTGQLEGLYKAHGFSLQKLGEEAVVDIEHFQTEVRRNKYFRHITNKFEREGYMCEVLAPPHASDLLDRLQIISDDWLKRPGRSERGFVMGYFDRAYLQDCPLVVAKDPSGTVQGFLNQVPSYDPEEANYDLLRHTEESPGNVNDFILLGLIDYLAEQGFKRLNLGLCPLAGLGDDPEKSLINNALSFLYANGDRFYSFSGLHRFKSKYEPKWISRYLAYKGGIRGFTRTITALPRALQPYKKH